MNEKKAEDLTNRMIQAMGRASFLDGLGAAVLVLVNVAKQAPREHSAEVARHVKAAINKSL